MCKYELEKRGIGIAINWPGTHKPKMTYQNDRPLSDALTVMLKAVGDLKLYVEHLDIDGERISGTICEILRQAKQPGDSTKIDCNESIEFSKEHIFRVLTCKD